MVNFIRVEIDSCIHIFLILIVFEIKPETMFSFFQLVKYLIIILNFKEKKSVHLGCTYMYV